MAPNITSQALLLTAETESVHTKVKDTSSNYQDVAALPTGSQSDRLSQEGEQYEWKISWRNVIAFLYLHMAAVYGLLLLLTGNIKFYTFLFGKPYTDDDIFK